MVVPSTLDRSVLYEGKEPPRERVAIFKLYFFLRFAFPLPPAFGSLRAPGATAAGRITPNSLSTSRTLSPK